jgi:hypothetical protein
MKFHSMRLVPIYKYEDWIPHISVGSEINKLGLVMRVGFLISQLDLRTISESWIFHIQLKLNILKYIYI